MSKSSDEMRDYLLYLEHALRKSVSYSTYDVQEGRAYIITAYIFMNDLADDIRAFLKEDEDE